MAELKNMARLPVLKRGIETKEKIINAAWILFSDKGYFKTNTKDIATKAGVATGSFYAYFNNKKDVGIELIRRFYKDGTEKVLSHTIKKISDMLAENPGPKTVRMTVKFIIESFKEFHAISPMLQRDALVLILMDEEVKNVSREEDGKILSFLIEILQQYKEYLRVDDVEAAATLLFRVSDEVMHRIMIHNDEIEAERLLRELEDMICNYIFVSDLK
ncbi:MAG: TetR/AcrR family transcriptional regulator [Proteobacteria bacterium]|nr:TetR/AcrR family transcriptional regulator [Pseudomonadota bacterium]